MSPEPIARVEADLGRWLAAVDEARDDGFTFFDFLTAVDLGPVAGDTGTEAGGAGDAGADPTRFEIVLHLYAPGGPALRETFVTTRIAEGERVPSLTGRWPGAAWHERETHEMFGIGFVGFDDGTGLGLRPLLLPDGFEGQPLRKSFVLTARASKAWPGAKDPGESKPRAGRRRMSAPGTPDPTWGPR